MKCLTYDKFRPTADSNKDFSELEYSIKQTKTYQIESKDASCLFVRGSALSCYDGGIKMAHKDSDIDIVKVSGEKNRRVNQYHEELSTKNNHLGISIDVTNLNASAVAREIKGAGDTGLTSMADLVQDCYPLHNKIVVQDLRDSSLFSYMRLGLMHYDGYAKVTPSGAMKAAQQGRLMINPLRWWSIEYAYKINETAEQNKLAYYDDIERMLEKNLAKGGMHEGEQMFTIPDSFELNEYLPLLKLKFWGEKGIGRLYSQPILSINDINKMRNKVKSLVIGVFEGKTTIDKIIG